MTWDYRIVRIESDVYTEYGLYEVYYDDDDVPNARTTEPCTFVGESVAEVISALEMARDAVLGRPILNESDFKGKPFGE